MNAATGTMAWSSHLAHAETLQEAVNTAAEHALAPLGSPPDLVFVFVSSLFRNHYHQVPRLMAQHCPQAVVLGCSGGGIIGGGQETEAEPAVSVVAARLPGVEVAPFSVADSELPDLDAGPHAWHDWLKLPAQGERALLLLADPFSVDVENLLRGLDFAWPSATKVGGLASGAPRAGGNALFLGDLHQSAGLVGVSLSGAVSVDAVVAQGCRPIGRPMVITECHRNALLSLEGRSPAEVLQELFGGLDERDRELMRTSLFLGLVMDASRAAPRRGDFLIRNIVGLDPTRGCLFVGSLLRPGQLVQFHLRDARTSAEDLEHMLGTCSTAPQAALLFSCLGRGRYLYGHANHDTAMFTRMIGEVPIGGFFCNGEIGPVGGTTYVHGYTSCFALITVR
ncbi:MAG: FIST signal transduction protein [Candidatus Xenobia bacterium]